MTSADSFECFFRTHFEPMTRSLSVAFGFENASDAVQEAFVQADRRWSAVGAYADPAGWVWRVALNRLLNGRRNVRTRRRILKALRQTDQEPHDTVVDIILVRDAVDRLPESMRLAISLHYLADLSVGEISELLDIAPGTVKSNLHDARRRLEDTLEVKPTHEERHH